ncbi:FmdB family zinc ribbon protein [Caenimonas koreensis]|uniref:Zinc ribbon domain-containing protein n=1 Tax=Caenimonas koreensis DSM 17982 TaxID=1121255 RepID=A0A844AV24_9BURK|nr:zinc ribbon domain-containing protein [Caenimonas koreensis]MRD46238.1 zinc ribbon domain-containing protein [Caenimonas koreensis DSM 17982]
MPIYAYKCATCGHAKDVLRKISDPPLTTCPACGAETFVKQVTAAGFQLKGSGWYATDFKNGSGATVAAPSDKSDKSGDGAAPAEGAKPAESKAADAKPADSTPKPAVSAPAPSASKD